MEKGRDSKEASRILRAADEGAPVDMDALLPLVYQRLRVIASRRMAGERKGHTLQTTALVNEAYLRLLGHDNHAWSSKAHFYAAAAESMRRILIDHARKRGSAKRGGGKARLPLHVVDLVVEDDVDQILSLDEAVLRLEELDPRMAQLVKLRFYAGLSEKDTAQALGVTPRTVRREWGLARAFLHRQLSEE
jgi:RNA polymerase sigma factor (TIGR02999 family)